MHFFITPDNYFRFVTRIRRTEAMTASNFKKISGQGWLFPIPQNISSSCPSRWPHKCSFGWFAITSDRSLSSFPLSPLFTSFLRNCQLALHLVKHESAKLPGKRLSLNARHELSLFYIFQMGSALHFLKFQKVAQIFRP